ncbi:hypothetical protein ACOJBM_06375 [Rhizobium beringeri]
MGVSAVQTMYTTLASYLGPLFLAGLTVYVVWWGYEMLFGRAQMTAGTFVWRFWPCLHLLHPDRVMGHLSAIDRKAPSWKRPMVWRLLSASRPAAAIAAGTAVPDRPSPKA